jgi:hypothetical protein
MTVSEVIAQAVSGDRLFFPGSLRRRTIWMAWAACGNASPPTTAVTLRVRRAQPPMSPLPVCQATGTWRQGKAASWVNRPG